MKRLNMENPWKFMTGYFWHHTQRGNTEGNLSNSLPAVRDAAAG